MGKIWKGVLIAMIFVMIWKCIDRFFLYEYTYLYNKGKKSQIEDNINHGVMNTSGQWLDEFKFAEAGK